MSLGPMDILWYMKKNFARIPCIPGWILIWMLRAYEFYQKHTYRSYSYLYITASSY